MASDIPDDMIDKAPTRGTHVTLGTEQEVGCMSGEINAEQGDMARGTIMIKKALAIRRPFEPEATLLHVLWRAVTEGPCEHSLRTCPRLLSIS